MPMPTDNRSPASGEIISARAFPATREQVFAAFSDPVRLAQWWGPKGFTNTFHQFEFRPGGTWRFTMRGPDGAAYEMEQEFTEIERQGRIVLRHHQAGHDFILAMTLVAQGDQTVLTWRMRFDDAAECERVRAFIIPANEQNFDRLAAHLAGTPLKS
jgi:uncharacterized protein YndB with AHSA1/START domain